MQLNKRILKLSFVLAFQIFLFATIHSATAATRIEGPSTGGGGNVCYHPRFSNRPVLLAFTTPSPGQRAFIDTAAFYAQKTSTQKVHNSKALNDLGIGRINFKTELREVYEEAQRILKFHGDSISQRSIPLIQEGARGLEFFAVTHKFTKSLRARTYGSSECEVGKNVFASAIYNGRYVVLSLPIFQALDFYSQVGVYLTEALRQIQITYGGDATDIQLQQLVAKMIQSKQPQNFDADPFFEKLFQVQRAKNFESRCKLVKELEPLSNELQLWSKLNRMFCLQDQAVELDGVVKELREVYSRHISADARIQLRSESAKLRSKLGQAIGNIYLLMTDLENGILESIVNEMKANDPALINATHSAENAQLLMAFSIYNEAPDYSVLAKRAITDFLKSTFTIYENF